MVDDKTMEQESVRHEGGTEEPTVVPSSTFPRLNEQAPQLKKQKTFLNEENSNTKERCDIDDTVKKPRRSFKVIGSLVLAMKRFQGSLNPTYTYGKQGTSSSSPKPSVSVSLEDSPHCSFQNRGHKASILLQRLPTPENVANVEEEAQSRMSK